MSFASSAINNPADGVRREAEKIYIHLYKDNPKLVRKYLPTDDEKSRRNKTYRNLFEEFDRIDGKV